MSYSTKLLKAMKERNCSQSQLAKVLGVNKASVSGWVSGRNIPRTEMQKKIATELDCELDWFHNEEKVDYTRLRNISIRECANILGKGEQFIRIALQQEKVPFGFAIKNGNKYSYHISPKKLQEYINTTIS